MLFFIIVVAVIIIVIYKFDNKKSGSAFAQVNNEAIKFFNSYLSLCKKHSVEGFCYYNIYKEKRYVKMGCRIDVIDGKTATRELYEVRKIWNDLQHQKMNLSNATNADKYIKKYFGCEDLHYLFANVNNYRFNIGVVIMGDEHQLIYPLYDNNNKAWKKPFKLIKEKLQRKWKTENIYISEDSDYIGISISNRS